MACCVLIAGAFAALLALFRHPAGNSADDPRAWRLTKDRFQGPLQ